MSLVGCANQNWACQQEQTLHQKFLLVVINTRTKMSSNNLISVELVTVEYILTELTVQLSVKIENLCWIIQTSYSNMLLKKQRLSRLLYGFLFFLLLMGFFTLFWKMRIYSCFVVHHIYWIYDEFSLVDRPNIFFVIIWLQSKQKRKKLMFRVSKLLISLFLFLPKLKTAS